MTSPITLDDEALSELRKNITGTCESVCAVAQRILFVERLRWNELERPEETVMETVVQTEDALRNMRLALNLLHFLESREVDADD